MDIQFDVNVWRNYYDQVINLGNFLRDSRHDADGNPPSFTITLEERRRIEREITQLTQMSNDYLDRCKLYPKEPKWVYNVNNEATWASSEKFIFHHLMPKKKYVQVSRKFNRN